MQKVITRFTKPISTAPYSTPSSLPRPFMFTSPFMAMHNKQTSLNHNTSMTDFGAPNGTRKAMYCQTPQHTEKDKDTAPKQTNQKASFWQDFFAEKPEPQKGTKEWWIHKIVVYTVFSITGSAALFIVRPVLHDVLHLQGTIFTWCWCSDS